MEQLNDDQIMKIFGSRLEENYESHYSRKEDIDSQFTLLDLVGKTISSHRKIRNVRKYNPECQSPNPEFFDVLEFNDGAMLLTENWGDLECGHLDFYYYNGKEVLFSDELFGI